jgi:anti-anti-sigma factor
MPSRALEAYVRHHQPRLAVIELHGEINGFAEAALNDAYAQASGQEVETILLNFADVDYINSNGIALIVGLLARARAGNTRLLASSLSEHYVEIFTITRLADFMTIFPDEASAMRSEERARSSQSPGSVSGSTPSQSVPDE